MLQKGGTDANLVARIEGDDKLVTQTFFWSAAGMKLFGGHEDLADPEKLRETLDDALAQQPSILVAFLRQTCHAAAKPDGAAEAGWVIVACLSALLAYMDEGGAEEALEEHGEALLEATLLLLDASSRHYDAVYEGALAAWMAADSSAELIDAFVEDFHPRLDPAEAGLDPAPDPEADSEEVELVVQSLAALFIAQPSRIVGFQRLIPRVFETHLMARTAARGRLNALLLKSSFDEALEPLIAESDELVRAPFFWNDQAKIRTPCPSTYPRLYAHPVPVPIPVPVLIRMPILIPLPSPSRPPGNVFVHKGADCEGLLIPQ